jgi:uncharacterized protein YutE (UPF0331/DUF86 family)
MSPLDRAVLAERTMALRRHLARVAEKLPARPEDLVASSDAADAVTLHLWQATQIVIDLAVAACAVRHAGTPQGYADAFRRLQNAGLLDPPLADRLVRAAGFRNVIVHAKDLHAPITQSTRAESGRVCRTLTVGGQKLRGLPSTTRAKPPLIVLSS